MMENLDTNIGRVLDALDELGLREKTIVVFTSDNGGLSTLAGDQPGPTCNLPLRCGKGWLYEGGIRVPCFISWPAKLQPATRDVPAYTADLYPTLLELCGLPAEPTQCLDGRSLASVLQGEPDAMLAQRPLAWYYPHDHGSGHRAVPPCDAAIGNSCTIWPSSQSELYDLAADPGETTDVSAQHPDETRSLREELVAWIQTTQQAPAVPVARRDCAARGLGRFAPWRRARRVSLPTDRLEWAWLDGKLSLPDRTQDESPTADRTAALETGAGRQPGSVHESWPPARGSSRLSILPRNKCGCSTRKVIVRCASTMCRAVATSIPMAAWNFPCCSNREPTR